MGPDSEPFKILSLIGDAARFFQEAGLEVIFFIFGVTLALYGCVAVIRQRATIHHGYNNNDDLFDPFPTSSDVRVEKLRGTAAVKYGMMNMAIGFLFMLFFFFFDELIENLGTPEATNSGQIQESS